MGANMLDAFLERFRDIADVLYYLFRFILDPLTGLFESSADVPVLGSVLSFFGETFGSGAAM